MSQPNEVVSELVHACLTRDLGMSGQLRFADAQIVATPPEPRTPKFYPDDRFLITWAARTLGAALARLLRQRVDDPGEYWDQSWLSREIGRGMSNLVTG